MRIQELNDLEDQRERFEEQVKLGGAWRTMKRCVSIRILFAGVGSLHVSLLRYRFGIPDPDWRALRSNQAPIQEVLILSANATR